MKWRNLLDFAPVSLLLIVMASQIYSMVLQTVPIGRDMIRRTGGPMMVSNFTVDYRKCAVATQQIGATLASGMRDFGSTEDPNDVLSKMFDGTLQIGMRLKNPGAVAFEAETRLLKPLINCGTSAWCEGRAPIEGYGDAIRPFIERLQAGEKVDVDIPGCAMTASDFNPRSWEMGQLSAGWPHIDALAIIALVIESAALYYLLQRPGAPTGASA